MAQITGTAAEEGRQASSPGGRSPVGKRRRRDDVLLSAIREAVRAETEEHGYAGVSFEGVARRAKTSKPVLYRRFRSRAHMVTDAFIAGVMAQPLAPSTGSLRGDLMEVSLLAVRQAHLVGSAAFRGLLGEADDELLRAIVDPHVVAVYRRIVRAAQARGELGPGQVSDLALLAGPSVIRMQILQSIEPVNEAFVARVIDEVVLPLLRTTAGRGSG